MSETEYAHDGICPRCEGADIEREVIRQTTAQVVSGVVFFCNTCGLTLRALASDREKWFDAHKTWQSPGVPEATLEDFFAKWPKKVGNRSYGSAEPIGPILPVVKN